MYILKSIKILTGANMLIKKSAIVYLPPQWIRAKKALYFIEKFQQKYKFDLINDNNKKLVS